jgi:hypothetical protein
MGSASSSLGRLAASTGNFVEKADSKGEASAKEDISKDVLRGRDRPPSDAARDTPRACSAPIDEDDARADSADSDGDGRAPDVADENADSDGEKDEERTEAPSACFEENIDCGDVRSDFSRGGE